MKRIFIQAALFVAQLFLFIALLLINVALKADGLPSENPYLGLKIVDSRLASAYMPKKQVKKQIKAYIPAPRVNALNLTSKKPPITKIIAEAENKFYKEEPIKNEKWIDDLMNTKPTLRHHLIGFFTGRTAFGVALHEKIKRQVEAEQLKGGA